MPGGAKKQQTFRLQDTHSRPNIFSELYSLSPSSIVGEHKPKLKAGQDESCLASEHETALDSPALFEQEYYFSYKDLA